MAIKNLGVTYTLGLDFLTIDTLSYGAIVIGRYDLAKELLLAGGQSEELVDKAIAATIQKLQQPQQENVEEVQEVVEEVPTATKDKKKNRK